VDDEAEVGLVEAHAERARRDQRRDAVGEQVVLGARRSASSVRPE
jgi:hypothetical protein